MEELMPRVAIWHSVKADVHHNNTNCNAGNNIERENVRHGSSGKPLCKECRGLNAQEQLALFPNTGR